jgi:hypothetical protein
VKTAVPRCPADGSQVEQSGLCSTCVPPAASKTRPGGTPAISCPVSKIGACSTWGTKKQNPPASARHSPVVALCGLFPGGAGTCPTRTAEATSERIAGKRKRAHPVILNEQRSPFSAPVQFAIWAKIPHPLDVGCGSRIKGGSSHPPPATPDGRADRENGSFPRLSAPACWICTKSQNLLSYTPEV